MDNNISIEPVKARRGRKKKVDIIAANSELGVQNISLVADDTNNAVASAKRYP